MSTIAILACLWVLAATAVAFLPMRWQIAPGLALLLSAPVLIAFVIGQTNLWIGLAASFAVISMFRKPLIYLAKRLAGRIAPRHGEERQ
ncbi:MAG: DUF2484 family protein [Rhodobacteraceae bacterium]|nr:DUF2484 family protein [Paracoccaceae bacterium]